MGGKRGSRGRPGLSGSIRKRGRGEGSSVLCGCLGRVTEFLHLQLLSPLESAPCIIASSLAPTILTGHPLPPWLSQAPKRSAQGPHGEGGRCVSPQIQWADCRWADMTSPRRAQLILLQGGSLSERNKHPLCWGQTQLGPLSRVRASGACAPAPGARRLGLCALLRD